jgi:hypothetical protein
MHSTKEKIKEDISWESTRGLDNFRILKWCEGVEYLYGVWCIADSYEDDNVSLGSMKGRQFLNR